LLLKPEDKKLLIQKKTNLTPYLKLRIGKQKNMKNAEEGVKPKELKIEEW
jgi:hypothetical protein